MLTSYYLGTGPYEIGNVLLLLGAPSGHSWYNIYNANMDMVDKDIIKIYHEILAE